MIDNEKGPEGLGGWLILTMLGLIVLPIRFTVSLITEFLPIFQEGYWEYLTQPESEFYHPYWAQLITLEMMGNTFFILFAVVLLILFFHKHHRFPALMISFLITNLLFLVIDDYAGDLIPAVASDEEAKKDSQKALGQAIIGACIWIPYFLISKRVKNTFVKTFSIKENEEILE